MSIRILTDSACDMPKDIAKKYNIRILPFIVTIDEVEYRDWYDLSSKEFFDKLVKAKNIPTTAQLTPLQLEEYFLEELKNYDELIFITISSKGSGTNSAAHLARKSIESEKIHIIDSKTFSYHYGYAVEIAGKMAKENFSSADIIW